MDETKSMSATFFNNNAKKRKICFFFDKKKKLQIVLCHKRIISLKFKISKIPNPTPQNDANIAIAQIIVEIGKKKSGK